MKASSVATRLGAVLAGAALIFCTPGPAMAADDGTVTVRVKSAKSVTASATHVNPATKARMVARVTANFTGHTTRSVRLTSFTLCHTATPKRSEVIAPHIEVAGKLSWRGTPKRDARPGTCHTWRVDKVYRASPGKRLFVLETQFGRAKLTTQHRYHR